MGCFSVFPCFTTSKHRKLHKSVTSSSSVDQGYECDSVLITAPTEKSTNLGSLKTPIWKSRDNSEDQLISDSGGKTVAIGLDVKTNTNISTEDVEILVVKSKEDKEKNVREVSGKLGVLVQLESAKERDNEKKKESGKLGVLVQFGNEKERVNGNYKKTGVRVEIENDKEEMEVEDEGFGVLGVLVQFGNEKERENDNYKKTGVHVEIENDKEEMEVEDEGFGVHVQIDNCKKIDREQNSENISSGVHVELKNESYEEKEVKTEEDQSKDQSKSVSDSSVSSYISYPPMHRYHNCVVNEDEDQVLIQEDSSESLFSLSIDPRRQSKSLPVKVDDKEVNSPLKTSSTSALSAKSIRSSPNELDHNESIDYLLNPIENLAQWKTLKARPMATLDLHQEKENVYVEPEEIPILISEEPVSKVSERKENLKDDTAVTTSLSSWLVGPEKSTTGSKEESQYSTGNSYVYSDEATSWKSFEDRPILGAWTIDEVRQISARSSPRKSPSHNPDETPIIGTVGSYWSHTGQTTDSSNSFTSPRGKSAKYRRNRENKALSCHSSPSRRRLERAFNKNVV